jgi:histidine phosphotransferase ChpT
MGRLYGAPPPFAKATNQAILPPMTQPHPELEPEPEIGQVPAQELAARLAAKLCHDFISPAGAIVSGLDLLDDPTAKDMRDEAMDLIASSARKLSDLLQFSRVAFGASAGADSFDSGELERLTQGVYAHVRAELDWAVAPQSLPKPVGIVLVNLAHIAAGALPTGGVARVEAELAPGGYAILIRAEGQRTRLHAEVAGGLAGHGVGDGLAGRWVQAYYVRTVAEAAGGTVAAEGEEGRVTFTAHLPI